MRWETLLLDDGAVPPGGSAPGGAEPAMAPLLERGAVQRRFDTPEFRGMTFFEVQARSVLNRVPAASRMPFRWTVNPYRGCSHACVYCFARQTHTYLDLDAGLDFDSKVVVKVNAAQSLRRELARASWAGEHVAMGTNVDPYQRVEGRYALMPGIIRALRDARTPFSVLTKGSLVLRDLDLLVEAAEVVDVGMSVSVGFVDRDLWRTVEPGTPSPQKRLDVCRALTDAGIACDVLMAPVMPWLTDDDAHLEATVRAIAAAGAASVSPLALHLRPGAKEWWFTWLRRERPDLVESYERLYGRGAYVAATYQRELSDRVQALAREHGVGRGARESRSPWRRGGRAAPGSRPAAGQQLALL